jgi:tRNA-uridine 2-sulfurtransferase
MGHEVVGLSLRVYDASGTSASAGGRCCGPRDLEDARRVAAHLGIAHYLLDRERAFHDAVVADFVAEYARGRTPNPCVRCNERIKFGPLLRHARALGCDVLATGHYARVRRTGSGPTLHRAADRAKDQSYFLFALGEAVLERVDFPLGAMTKADVRAAARAQGLPVADKPESMEICFVPDGDHAAFVRARAPGAAGHIVTEDGRAIGRHAGLHLFTVGQKRGTGGRTVLRLEPEAARVVVGPEHAVFSDRARVGDLRWIGARPDGEPRALIQVRHRHEPAPARLRLDGATAEVRFDAPVRALAPGQAAVFYEGDRVLGGGWIE